MQGAKHDSLFAHVSVAHSLLALLARIHDEWWTSPGSSCSKRRPFATWQPKLCDWSCAKRIKGVALQAIEESRRDFVSGVLLGEMANLVEFPKKKDLSSFIPSACHLSIMHISYTKEPGVVAPRWSPPCRKCAWWTTPKLLCSMTPMGPRLWRGAPPKLGSTCMGRGDISFQALSTLCFYPGVALPSSKKSWIE